MRRPYREPQSVAWTRGAANGVLWQAWPWVSWLLPVFLFFVIYATNTGGWEIVFLMIFSPLLLPAYALMNILPRFLMHRVGGYLSSTTTVSIAMIVNWWSLILIALSNRGVGDSGSVDSVLGERFSRFPEPAEDALRITGVLFLLISYVVAIIGAIAAATDGRDQREQARAAAADELDPGAEAPLPPLSQAPVKQESSLWVNITGIAAPALIIFGVAVGNALGGS